jgi:hypothetical protein
MDVHKRLLDTQLAVNGYALMCGYENDLYENRLAAWRNVSLPTVTQVVRAFQY